MRVLHLVHRSEPFHGGAERYVTEHALAGVRRGHECVIATTDAWDITSFTRRSAARIGELRGRVGGVDIIRFRIRHPVPDALWRTVLRRLPTGGPDRFYHPNPFVPSLGRWLSRDRGFGFVHANAMPFLLFQGWRHASRFGAGLASVPHANIGERFRRLESIRYLSGTQPRILRESSFVCAQSSFERDLFLEAGVPGERIHLSGSGIDPGEFEGAEPERWRRILGGGGSPIVLSLTAHSPDRGSGHLIEACLRLWGQGADFRLVLAGPVNPDFHDTLERAAREAEPGRMILTGRVDREDRAGLIRAADIVALPSRLDCFGIILLEAWACSRPVVGCWSGAMPDLVRDCENGFLVNFGDPATLADRISRLLRDEGMRRAFGESGRSVVIPGMTWRRVTDRFYDRLAECVPPEAPG